MAEMEAELRQLRDQVAATGAVPPRPHKRRAPLLVAASLFLIAVAAGTAYTLHERGVLSAAPPPAPATPTTVEVVFDSQPQGAEVFVDGRDDPLGMTPFSANLKRAETRTFHFELAGYHPASQEVPLRQNTRVAVVMAEVDPAAPALELEPQKKAKRKAPTRRGTMNPFE
jgi:hypothetical protein